MRLWWNQRFRYKIRLRLSHVRLLCLLRQQCHMYVFHLALRLPDYICAFLLVSPHLPPSLRLPLCNSRLSLRSLISWHLNRLHSSLPAALLPSVRRHSGINGPIYSQFISIGLVASGRKRQKFLASGSQPHYEVQRAFHRCIPSRLLWHMWCIRKQEPMRIIQDNHDITLRKKKILGNYSASVHYSENHDLKI